MSQQKPPDDDLGWGTPPTAAASHKSSFTEPQLVTDISDREDDAALDHHDSSGDHADDDVEHSSDDVNETAAVKSPPNYAILAMVGVLGLSLVGGMGWWANKQFFSKPSSAQSRSSMQAESVFNEPAPTQVAGGLGSAEAINVFDTPPVPAAAGIPAAAASSPGPAAPVPAALPSAQVVAPAAAAAPVAPAVVAPTVPVVTSTAPKTTAVAAKVSPAASNRPAPVVTSETVATQSVETKVLTKKTAKRTVARSRTKERLAQRRVKKAKTLLAKSTGTTEVFLLPRGMSVRSIYPASGPNAQAWVSDSAGRVQIVRVGESLRSGPQVTAIRGETGEVTTTSGVLSTRGVTQ